MASTPTPTTPRPSLPHAQPTVTVPLAALTTYPQPLGVPIAAAAGIAIASDVLTLMPIARVSVCYSRALLYLQNEDALVCPPPESLTAAALTCTWAPSQLTGGCAVISAPAAGAPALSFTNVLWQTRLINGAPYGGPTTGARGLVVTAVDSAGAAASAQLLVDVGNAPAVVAGSCPLLQSPSLGVDVLVDARDPRLSALGVLVAPDAVVEAGLGGLLVNAHVRISGGCLPAEDLLVLDYTLAPAALVSQVRARRWCAGRWRARAAAAGHAWCLGGCSTRGRCRRDLSPPPPPPYHHHAHPSFSPRRVI